MNRDEAIKTIREALEQLDCTCGCESDNGSDYSFEDGGCYKHDSLSALDSLAVEPSDEARELSMTHDEANKLWKLWQSSEVTDDARKFADMVGIDYDHPAVSFYFGYKSAMGEAKK